MDKLKEEDDTLFNRLKLTRQAVIPLLEDLKHKHFTKHDVNHSDRIRNILSHIPQAGQVIIFLQENIFTD